MWVFTYSFPYSLCYTFVIRSKSYHVLLGKDKHYARIEYHAIYRVNFWNGHFMHLDRKAFKCFKKLQKCIVKTYNWSSKRFLSGFLRNNNLYFSLMQICLQIICRFNYHSDHYLEDPTAHLIYFTVFYTSIVHSNEVHISLVYMILFGDGPTMNLMGVELHHEHWFSVCSKKFLMRSRSKLM